jgi:hypothetical protein
VKGSIDYYGSDRLACLLWNCGGSQNGEAERADERVKTYGMQAMPRVRVEFDEFARESQRLFGQHGYGSIVIGADGSLLAANVHGAELGKVLAAAFGDAASEGESVAGELGDDKADDSDTGDSDAGPFQIKAEIRDVTSGRPGFNIAHHLTRDMEATLVIELKLPEGYHAYGAGPQNPEPTKVEVVYAAGVVLDAPVIQGVQGSADGVQHVPGPVRIHLPIKVPKGTAIGNYLVHGKVRFMACNDQGCLPATELRWQVNVVAL